MVKQPNVGTHNDSCVFFLLVTLILICLCPSRGLFGGHLENRVQKKGEQNQMAKWQNGGMSELTAAVAWVSFFFHWEGFGVFIWLSLFSSSLVSTSAERFFGFTWNTEHGKKVIGTRWQHDGMSELAVGAGVSFLFSF
jgi:hypothetical protein